MKIYNSVITKDKRGGRYHCGSDRLAREPSKT